MRPSTNKTCYMQMYGAKHQAVRSPCACGHAQLLTACCTLRACLSTAVVLPHNTQAQRSTKEAQCSKHKRALRLRLSCAAPTYSYPWSLGKQHKRC